MYNHWDRNTFFEDTDGNLDDVFVESGVLVGSSLVLSRNNASDVTIPDVNNTDDFDHFISGSTTVPVSEPEANTDWDNA